MNAAELTAKAANYRLLDFGIYVPSHVAEKVIHLDLGTLNEYNSFLRGRGRSEATIEKYTRAIRRFVLYLGERSLCPDCVHTWLEILKQTQSIQSVNGTISDVEGDGLEEAFG